MDYNDTNKSKLSKYLHGTNNLERTYIVAIKNIKDLSWRLKEHSVVATLISSGIPFHKDWALVQNVDISNGQRSFITILLSYLGADKLTGC